MPTITRVCSMRMSTALPLRDVAVDIVAFTVEA
jgi:hypothetical protein